MIADVKTKNGLIGILIENFLNTKFMRPDNYLFDVINRAKFYPDRLTAQSPQI